MTTVVVLVLGRRFKFRHNWGSIDNDDDDDDDDDGDDDDDDDDVNRGLEAQHSNIVINTKYKLCCCGSTWA